jgi:hypothetical protein
MLRTTLLVAVLLFAGAGVALAQREYCFKNDGLDNVSTLRFKVTGKRFTGNYTSAPHGDDSPLTPVRFTGTLSGKVMNVKFGAPIPDEFTHMKTIRWTRAGDVLRVPMYGKNYFRDKWGVFPATFEGCPLLRPDGATRISFPPGRAGVSETVTLSPGETAKYVVAARAAQLLSFDSSEKEAAISLLSGKVTAQLSEPGHFEATLLAKGDYIFEVKNTSAEELTVIVTVVINDIHVDK